MQPPSTALLQALLDLPQPRYHHHRLILDADGNKLSKSTQSTGLRELARAAHRRPISAGWSGSIERCFRGIVGFGVREWRSAGAKASSASGRAQAREAGDCKRRTPIRNARDRSRARRHRARYSHATHRHRGAGRIAGLVRSGGARARMGKRDQKRRRSSGGTCHADRRCAPKPTPAVSSCATSRFSPRALAESVGAALGRARQ